MFLVPCCRPLGAVPVVGGVGAGFAEVESTLPFAVEGHQSAKSHVAREMLRRLKEDVQFFANEVSAVVWHCVVLRGIVLCCVVMYRIVSYRIGRVSCILLGCRCCSFSVSGRCYVCGTVSTVWIALDIDVAGGLTCPEFGMDVYGFTRLLGERPQNTMRQPLLVPCTGNAKPPRLGMNGAAWPLHYARIVTASCSEIFRPFSNFASCESPGCVLNPTAVAFLSLGSIAGMLLLLLLLLLLMFC